MTTLRGRFRILRILLATATAAAACSAVALAAGSSQESLPKAAVVTKVVEGDIVAVRLESGARLQVRLLGIDAPDPGNCYAAEARAVLTRLALRRGVTLRGDGPRETRDARGRLLAYVDIGRIDVARELLIGGFARIASEKVPARRLATYKKAERVAQRAVRGIWACPSGGSETPPSTTP